MRVCLCYYGRGSTDSSLYRQPFCTHEKTFQLAVSRGKVRTLKRGELGAESRVLDLRLSQTLTFPVFPLHHRVVLKFVEMKAISPIRSVRSCYEAVCCISEQSLTISRSKTPTEEPAGALCDMNDCYSKLKELVPSIPQNKSVSQVEILQHVIDYIFDLQIALQQESSETDAHAPDMILSLKSSDIACKFSKEDGGVCH
ncbi:hypothetical protein ACEWY4_027757 [Coilia grayii]|uniref:DNA-binding protein inhibitor ID-4 n=1 Tax=Coilia grayii TaxID=363190 RepID=A0ABD1IQZ9_9TELE